MNRRLADAQDAQLARVVAVVDALPKRGAADDLVASFRPRLARVRPARPMHFTRILFQPLEPLLVQAPRWRPGLPAIPRSVLHTLAATVRAGLGVEVAAIDRLIAGRTMHDAAIGREVGECLWPRAAQVLAAAPHPVAWAETGLNEIVYPPLARRIAAVLAQLGVLHELMAEAGSGILPPRLPPVCAMLRSVAAQCADALPTMLALLLARLPQAAVLLPDVAAKLGPQVGGEMQAAAEHAAEVLLLRLEGGYEISLVAGGLRETAAEAQRIVVLMRELAANTTAPERRQRLAAIRERVAAACQTQFAHGLAEEFLAPLQALDRPPDEACAAGLENAARHLRELEMGARPIGGGETYDALVRQAVSAVAADDAALGLADQVRLVEILSGPEAALALLAMQERRTPG